MIGIDGSHLEGGGQIVRSAVALSAITGKQVRIRNIRAGREKPGLRPQHLAGIAAAADMCGANTTGLAPGSHEIVFSPHGITGGDHHIDIKTAGAVTLILQTVIPIASHAHEPLRILVRGGTAVPFSPTVHYVRHLLCPLLSRLGVDANVTLGKHGFYPAGGGEILAQVRPAALHAVELLHRGSRLGVEAVSFATHDLQQARVAERMLDGFRVILPEVHASYRYVNAASTGCFISSRAVFQHACLGADELGKRGKRAEDVGRDAALNLKQQLSGSATIDVWMVDQIIPYLALAAYHTGKVSRISIPGISMHARTSMWVVSSFLPVGFRTEDDILECYSQT